MTKFAATAAQPHHLSVGAVLTAPDGRYILVDGRDATAGRAAMMTETVEDGEPLESAVLRGIREELGVPAHIMAFLGASQVDVHDHRGRWCKTVIWFKCAALAFPTASRLVERLDDLVPVDLGRWPPHELIAELATG